jgi:hypothetical protein
MKDRPPQKEYTIEHLIEGADGILRPVTPEDVDIDNNKHVREAFRMIYEWHRRKEKYADRRQAGSDCKGGKSVTYKKK